MGAYTRRLIRTAKRADERDRAGFVREERCHDCAWRAGSPEQLDPELWAKLKQGAKHIDGVFWCHLTHEGVEMPTGPDGEYCPRIKRGAPVGFPICKGWSDAFDVHRRRALADDAKDPSPSS